MQRVSMLRKGRRVEHNQVVSMIVGSKKFECILAKRLVSVVGRKVLFHVSVGQFDSLCTAVYRVNQPGPSSHGIHREAARIAKHVQDASALCIFLQQSPIVALIDKEPRLLSLEPIHLEKQSVFQSHVAFAATMNKAILLS